MAVVVLILMAILVLGALSYTYGALLVPLAIAAWWQRDYLRSLQGGEPAAPTNERGAMWLPAIALTAAAAIVIGVVTHQPDREPVESTDYGDTSSYVPQYWQDECARRFRHEPGSGDVSVFDETDYDSCIAEHTVEGEGEAGTYEPGDAAACAHYDDAGDFAACMDGSISP